jgi:hypothetical protein
VQSTNLGGQSVITVRIELRDVYGRLVAYPRNAEAEAVARIANTKTLTRSALRNARDLGCGIEVIDRFGNVSRSYDPGRVQALPAIA